MYQYDYPHPAVTVDVVVFTLRDGQLKLLLIKRAGEPYRGVRRAVVRAAGRQHEEVGAGDLRQRLEGAKSQR